MCLDDGECIAIMNLDEKLAESYLKSLELDSVIFEPDGNVPPDFLINQQVAVEVRRLNQHKKGEGLETSWYRLFYIIKGILDDFGKADSAETYFVSYYFSRPIGFRKNLRSKIKTVLENHLILGGSKNYYLGEFLEINIFPSSNALNQTYNIGAISDRDGGGFVVANVYQNLLHIIREKEKKITPYNKKYPHWWLIVIDHISYGLDQTDKSQLRDIMPIETVFEKVILLNKKDGSVSFHYK